MNPPPNTAPVITCGSAPWNNDALARQVAALPKFKAGDRVSFRVPCPTSDGMLKDYEGNLVGRRFGSNQWEIRVDLDPFYPIAVVEENILTLTNQPL